MTLVFDKLIFRIHWRCRLCTLQPSLQFWMSLDHFFSSMECSGRVFCTNCQNWLFQWPLLKLCTKLCQNVMLFIIFLMPIAQYIIQFNICCKSFGFSANWPSIIGMLMSPTKLPLLSKAFLIHWSVNTLNHQDILSVKTFSWAFHLSNMLYICHNSLPPRVVDGSSVEAFKNKLWNLSKIN